MPTFPVIDTDARTAVIDGDCIKVMSTMPEASVDAIICDPPYGIAFMEEWDDFGRQRKYQSRSDEGYGHKGILEGYGRGGPSDDRVNFRYKSAVAFQEWCEKWAREALRVAKPGAHILAFGGTRTSHRLVCALENAGWEVRDTICWMHSQGFPKSLDISKAIDNAAGAKREVLGTNPNLRPAHKKNGRGFDKALGKERLETMDVTAPATEAAKKWDGFGTSTKPAFEPVVVARKPFSTTVAENVLRYGTGALNIDGCRVSFCSAEDQHSNNAATRRWRRLPRPPFGSAEAQKHADNGREGEASANKRYTDQSVGSFAMTPGPRGGDPKGRWPTNVVFSHTPECVHVGTKRVVTNSSTIDQVGTGSGDKSRVYGQAPSVITSAYANPDGTEYVDDWQCVDGCPVKALNLQAPNASRFYPQLGYDTDFDPPFFHASKASRSERDAGLVSRFEQAEARLNPHPTVKSVPLMRWLVRLVTPPNGIVLDPFVGSGSTGVAAALEQFRFLGIELNPTYAEIARKRIGYAFESNEAKQQSLGF